MPMMKSHRPYTAYLAAIACALILGQLLLVLASWMISSAVPESNVHSLLGSEGTRWLFGRFTDNISGPPLAWIILIGLSIGCYRRCGIHSVIRITAKHGKLSFRQKYALRVTLIALLCCAFIIIICTCAPHAVLLSSTGKLFPSSFSAGIVPVITLCLMLLSVIFGLAVGRFGSLTDVFEALTCGIPALCPALLIYILAAQLYFSVQFVFF